MTLTLWIDAPTEEGDTIYAGTTVGYLGHVPGGLVRVRVGSLIRTIDPRITNELK